MARFSALLVLVPACLLCAATDPPVRASAYTSPPVTLSIVSTTDLHGYAQPRSGMGGLPLLAGYVNNLRRARAADGGAVLLVDSGDTFQGDVESSLNEGAFVVDAYNSMGYAAEAIGNHDFDFGAVDSPSARQTPRDLRGAIKARAAQARFPFLAANLIDASTGRLVQWPNVRPSVVVIAAGVKVGIIGALTVDALHSTIAANVQGLRVAPLEAAVRSEALRLRAAGADIVVLAAHAGGRCTRFDDPHDLSSCDQDSEVFRLANALPRDLVDVIAAGHTHGGLGHEVNGIAIVQSYSHGQAFSRVDVAFDLDARAVRRTHIFPPQSLCVRESPVNGNCGTATDDERVPNVYEGQPVVADPGIARAMQPELQRVQRLEATRLGVPLAASVGRVKDQGSPLGNVFADAIRHAVPGADVAVINNASRGLWADLPEGPLTLGGLYTVFPFDNRIARITLTGAELGRFVRDELRESRRGSLGVSGVSVRASCGADGLHVDLLREGALVHDDDRLLVVTIGGPTLSGNVASDDALDGGPADNGPVVREVVEDWLAQGADLATARIADARGQRIDGTNAATRACP